MKRLIPFLLCGLLALSACDKLGLDQPADAPPQSLTDQGHALLAKNQPAEAVMLFDQAIAKDPKDVRAYQGKGIALNSMGNHIDAEMAYSDGLKVAPGAIPLTNNLAMSKILRGEYQQAINVLKPLAGTNETVDQNLALANCLLGKKEEARKLYGKKLTPAETEDNLKFCNKYEQLRKS